MAGGGESVATHATVVAVFVFCLTEGCEAYDNVAGLDVGVVDDIGATHTASHRRVDDDCADEVAHVGGLTAGRVDADTHFAESGEEFLSAVDDCRNNFAGDEVLVSANCR